VSHADLESDSATNLMERSPKVHTNHELMEHTDAKATMIYTHVLNRGIVDIKSAADIVFS